MGGSGGGGYFSGATSPEELRKQVRDVEERTRSQEFDAEISAMIGDVLTDVNTRDPDSLRQHIDTIRQTLTQDIAGTIDMRFGGSIAKHTYVDGLSDADSLVVLDRSELRDATPEEVKHYFAERLRQRLPNTEIVEGQLAVTAKFRDIDVQLIPAIRSGTGIKIPDADGVRWSSTIRPDAFARKLSAVNQRQSGKVVPAVKLAKVLLAKLPAEQQLSGYHVESLAIKIFEEYSGSQTTKAMLKHFFTEAPRHIRQPIKDSTGQSLHVDEYLGGADSVKRRVVGESVARIGRTMANADRAQSKEQWGDLLA
jgi:hypothetical protein